MLDCNFFFLELLNLLIFSTSDLIENLRLGKLLSLGKGGGLCARTDRRARTKLEPAIVSFFKWHEISLKDIIGLIICYVLLLSLHTARLILRAEKIKR